MHNALGSIPHTHTMNSSSTCCTFPGNHAPVSLWWWQQLIPENLIPSISVPILHWDHRSRQDTSSFAKLTLFPQERGHLLIYSIEPALIPECTEGRFPSTQGLLGYLCPHYLDLFSWCPPKGVGIWAQTGQSQTCRLWCPRVSILHCPFLQKAKEMLMMIAFEGIQY